MPKFRVSVSEKVVTYYTDAIVEAPTATDAVIKAEEMAMNGELTEGGGKSDWSSDVAEFVPATEAED